MSQEPAAVKGTVGFEIRVPIEVAEMRTWSPERCAAFFNGLGQALAAFGHGGSIMLQLPPRWLAIEHNHLTGNEHVISRHKTRAAAACRKRMREVRQ